MKLNHYMRYPHPVLSEYSGDYLAGAFGCTLEQNLTSSGELRLVSNLQIDVPKLRELIDEQAAAVGYYVVCRRTYFNKLQEASLGISERFFDANQLFGSVTIRPVMWTLRTIGPLDIPLMDPEFGKSVAVRKGAIIALGPEFRFSMDQKKYKPFDSIFELAVSDTVSANSIAVDHDRERITILAPSETYKSIAAIRDMNRGKEIILNTVYLPAVIEVLSRLQVGGINVESRKWYRVFKAKCDEIGINNPADPNKSPLVVAQELLRGPLRKTISLMESLS